MLRKISEGLKDFEPQIVSRLKDPNVRSLITGGLVMGLNLLYAVFNLIMGIVYRSSWFAVMSAYYLILAVMRLFAVSFGGNLTDKLTRDRTLRSVGAGMLLLASVTAVMTVLAVTGAIARAKSIVLMIGVAVFTIAIAARAVINVIKALREHTVSLILLRNISLVSAVGSVLSLERSLLATFGDPTTPAAYTLEAVSGAAAAVLMLILGLSMLALTNKRVQDHIPDAEEFKDR